LFYINVLVVGTMRLTNRDRNIIEKLTLHKLGLSERGLCNSLNIKLNSRGTINKRLNRLYERGVINRIGNSPKLYYMEKISDVREFELTKIKCLKCGFMEFVKRGQEMKVCTKCKHKYWITAKRIISVANDINC